MKEQYVLLVDDDSLLVEAMAPELRAFLYEKGMKFLAFSASDEVEDVFLTRDDVDLVAVILDLWMVDKVRNTSDRDAGIKLLKLLRKKWPDTYILIYSGHINAGVRKDLDNFQQLAIMEKTVSSSVILGTLSKIIEDQAD